MRTITTPLAVFALVLAACTSASEPDPAPPATAASTTAASTTIAPVDTTSAEAATTTTTVQSEGPPYIGGIDLPVVQLLTAPDGVGERPLLEWNAVEGAARYDVLVLDSDGTTYWAWSTTDTSVFVGGIEITNLNAPGPRIQPGMTWVVLGFDETGLLMAQSARRPISPN